MKSAEQFRRRAEYAKAATTRVSGRSQRKTSAQPNDDEACSAPVEPAQTLGTLF
jgi:hypothetical protein